MKEILKMSSHFFLEEGADPNLPDTRGETALHLAASVYSPEIVTMLLEAGADPTLQNKEGKTPLEIARWYSRDAIVEVLEQAINKPSKGKRRKKKNRSPKAR